MTEPDYDAPVEADDATMADLLAKFGTTHDTTTLVAYAAEHGIHPPEQPEGYEGWVIALRYEPGDEDGRLFWVGPDDDDDDGDYPIPTRSPEDDPWAEASNS